MSSLTRADLERALPDLVTSHRFEQVRSGAVIRRDSWGIPHIRSDDEHDLFFAQGFATAQDRLFQMDYDRLRALGRIAEYIGPQALPQDRLMRRRRLDRVSKLDYASSGVATRSALDAYADGVNAFIESTNSFPIEYTLLGVRPEPWLPWHSVAVFKVRNTGEGSFQTKLWVARLVAHIGPEETARLSPGYLPGNLLSVPPGARYNGSVRKSYEELSSVVEAAEILRRTDGGSNGWVLSGRYTKSGLPLLAGDAHRALEVPNVYYQVHLIEPGTSVLGYSIPGFPMVVHFCHNKHVAWGMTMGSVDTQDLFVERFRVENGQLQYQNVGQWLDAKTTLEIIKVRGGSDEQLEIVETHRGPVIAGEPRSGASIVLSDPGAKEGTPWIDAAYHAMRAQSADALEEALSGWTDRVNNYVYADVHGNFGYCLRGRIPIRDTQNGWAPVPGWTGRHDWVGHIPPADLPRSRNPETGWVVTCNQRIVDEHYPFYLSNIYGTAYRAERVAARLEELKRAYKEGSREVTLEDMSSIHAEAMSIPAKSVQKGLGRLTNLSCKAADAARALLDWDCQLRPGCARAALYEVTAAHLAEHLIRACYGDLAEHLLSTLDAGGEQHWRLQVKPSLLLALEHDDPSWLPEGKTWDLLLSDSLNEAISYLERRFETDWTECRWGELHRCASQHPLAAAFPESAALLNPPAVEIGGDGDTPLMSGSKIGDKFLTTTGSVNRYIYDPSNWSNGRWIVPLGASGHPGSVHYSDQQLLWAQAKTIPQLWDWDEIGCHTETEQTFDRLISYPTAHK